MADIDPRLKEQLAAAGKDGEVEAALVLHPSPAASDDERGPGGQLLDRVAGKLQTKLSQVKYFPRLGTLVVKGKADLVWKLLRQKEVLAASATEP